MLWELALFSIFLPASYWGVHHVRRQPFGSATFGWMLLGAAAACAVAWIGYRNGAGSWADALGVIGIGVGACTLIVAPMLRGAARWAVTTDRLTLAAVLVDVCDVLQPGMGGGDNKRMIEALRDVKEGRVDHAVSALEALRERAPTGAAAAIDERIVLLYLSAQRFEDAVRWAERTLLEPGGRLSPPLCVELVGARLRLGQLDQATELAERFLASTRNAPELVFLSYRLQYVFLAHLGRVTEVDRLLDPRQAAMVSRAARRYWSGVARHAAGDVAGARAAFDDAMTLARRDRRSRALVELGLEQLDRPAPTATPAATALADRLVAEPIAMPPRAPGRRAAVTSVLVALNVAVAAICGLALGGWGDIGSVVRVGASVHGAVAEGEAWRLASSVFVHIGAVHLVVNVLALWVLGRLVEGLFGRARMFAIYGVAGIGGAFTSFAFGAAHISAGASGAIFGLLGAAIVELAIHHRRYRREWRRALLQSLLFVTVAQLLMGFGWKMVDQWAHVGGLVCGAAVALALSPGWRLAETAAGTTVARVLAGALVAAFAWSGFAAATTDYADTLAAAPRITHAVGPVEVVAPASWRLDRETGELVAQDGFLVLGVEADPAEGRDAATRLADHEERELRRAIDSDFEHTARADRVLVTPEGWLASEWIVSATDELGSQQRFRLLTFAADGYVGALYLPDVLARDGASELAAILATIR